MQYREFEVPAALRRQVQCLWWLRDGVPSPEPQAIYPDGRCELILHLGAPMRRQEPGGDWQVQARALFAAQQCAPVRLAATGPVACLGLRLQPAASAALVGAGLPGLRDRIVDLAGLDAAFAQALLAAGQAFEAGGDPGPVWALVQARLGDFEVDPRIETAVDALDAARGDLRVQSLAAGSGLSLRAFQQRFQQAVGLGPKQYARVLRLQASLRALDGDSAALADMAAATGFADQAHATRELQRLTGLTPARLWRALRDQRQGDRTLALAAAFVRGYG